MNPAAERMFGYTMQDLPTIQDHIRAMSPQRADHKPSRSSPKPT